MNGIGLLISVILSVKIHRWMLKYFDVNSSRRTALRIQGFKDKSVYSEVR